MYLDKVNKKNVKILFFSALCIKLNKKNFKFKNAFSFFTLFTFISSITKKCMIFFIKTLLNFFFQRTIEIQRTLDAPYMVQNIVVFKKIKGDKLKRRNTISRPSFELNDRKSVLKSGRDDKLSFRGNYVDGNNVNVVMVFY